MIISSDCADIYSPKVIRAAMGAVFKINICVVENLKDALLELKFSDKVILGAALNKKSLVLGKIDLSQKNVIVIGNEGHGLSNEILSVCDNTLFIPMSKNTESLNAAMAATIIMWEISKNYDI
jgi:TrmH family RNA methyltransferase